MNVIKALTSTVHIVSDVHRYDDLVEDGNYAAWSDCGISVTGKLFRKAENKWLSDLLNCKRCKKCFK